MRNLKAVIIDDEQSARNVLKNLIERSETNVKVVASSSNLEEGVLQIKKNDPDVVFLDIQMPNYFGYEIARFFNEINFEIIFVTAYDQYAIKAFELSAVDYLVKPINRQRLYNSIVKASERISNQNKLLEYQILEQSFKDRVHKKIVIPELGNKRVVCISAIIAIEADGSYCKVYLTDNSEILLAKNLKYFENVLSDCENFERIHRTWFINKDHVLSINKTQLAIGLTNAIEAKISRGKWAELGPDLLVN